MSTLREALRTERGLHVAGAVFMAGLSATFMFCGYEFVRSPVESIFIDRFGAGAKPYAIACVPFAMAALIYGYGRLLSAVGPRRAMAVSLLASAAAFTLAWALLGTAGRWLAFALLVFKEAYVVVIAEQYWSFINSVLRDEEGKVFNGPVAGLGALGSLTGGWFLGRHVMSLGTENFLLLSALLMLPAAWLFWIACGRAGEPKPAADEAGGRKGHLHLSILAENRTVLLIAFIIFSAQVVATALDFRWTLLVQDAFPLKDERTAFFGRFWMWVNVFSFSMQFVLTPLLLRRVSRRTILTAIPAVHVLSCALLLFYPSLGLASASFLLFKGLDYSLFRAAKETLYIPFSYDTRYRAKQVADAFMYRFAKGLTATWISALKAAGSVAPAFYPALAVVFSGAWLAMSFPLTAGDAGRRKT
jgi:ATP:ADP antiporter, AAA family